MLPRRRPCDGRCWKAKSIDCGCICQGSRHGKLNPNRQPNLPFSDMRARYEVVRSTPKFVLIRDIGHTTGPSITNDAQHVVVDMFFRGLLVPGQRLLYIDSEGKTDEMLLTPDARFLGFSSGDGGLLAACAHSVGRHVLTVPEEE